MTTEVIDEGESFLEVYLKYTQKQESPALFHLWTGLTVLSVILGRKCYLSKGYYTLYPNLFTVLVAGSARCRKSTAINIGVDLLRDIPTIKIISGKITPERFIEKLEQGPVDSVNGAKAHISPNILVHSSELSVFLTKQSYGEPLIHILTDLFDCPAAWPYETKNRGQNFLKDVFLTILAATTPTGVALGIPPAALHEGFASRVLFCFAADTDRRNALPELSQEEVEMHIQLKAMLNSRAMMHGEFKLSPEAKAWYNAWYDHHMGQNPEDSRMDGMYGRKHDHLLRLGLIMAGDRQTHLIGPHHLEAGLMALENLEHEAPGAFREMGGDENTPHMARLKSLLRKHKVMHHSLVLKKLYPVNATILGILLDTAFQTGWLKRDPNNARLYLYVEEEKE